MDQGSFLGLALTLAAVVSSLLLGGGSIFQILQLPPALIVLGGTLGSCLMAHTARDVKRALSALSQVFFQNEEDLETLKSEILTVAQIVRKDGLLAVESQATDVADESLKRAVKYLAEGLEPKVVYEILDNETKAEIAQSERVVKVFDSAAEFAPVAGIVGSILGMIQVMTAIDDPSKLGQGLAAAFVSALYGLALSNFFLQPAAHKLKASAGLGGRRKEFLKMGVMGIQEGLNPLFLEERLNSFLGQAPATPASETAAEAP